MIKTFYFFKKLIFKIFRIFYLKLAVYIFFYFNSDYPKGRYVINEKRKLKKSIFSWERLLKFRSEVVAWTYYDEFDKQMWNELQRAENVIRYAKHEVLDFPLVWQPDIVDEKEDWRYRRSAYLRRGILRIVLHYKEDEIANFTYFERTSILFKFFAPIFLLPPIIIFLYINRMEIFHWAIYISLFNEYFLKNIGFSKDTPYSLATRLYYHNFIEESVNFLMRYSENIEAQILAKFSSDFGPIYSLPVKYLRIGIHNRMVVNKVIIEVVHYYKRNELDDFLIKEILSEYSRRWKLRIKKYDEQRERNENYFSKLRDSIRMKRFQSYVPIFSHNPFFRTVKREDTVKEHYYCFLKEDKVSVWASDLWIDDTSIVPCLHWRYDECGIYDLCFRGENEYFRERYQITMSEYPTILEEVRSYDRIYTYPTDLIFWITKKVYKMIKPKNNSFFWTILNFLDNHFNITNKTHELNKYYIMVVEPVLEAYSILKSTNQSFGDLIRNSRLGYYVFFQYRHGNYIDLYTETGEAYSAWKRGNNEFLANVPYDLVSKPWYSFKEGKDAKCWAIGFGFATYIQVGEVFPIIHKDVTCEPGKLSRYTFPDNAMLDTMKEVKVFFSSLDIFWMDYDLGLNLFANFTALNLLIDFLAIIFLFMLFTFNVKSIKVYNSYIVKKIYFFFWDLFKNLVLNIRLERFFFLIISYFFCIIFFNLGGFSFYELSFMSHVSITFFFSFSIFINYVINLFVNFNEVFYLKFVQKANIILIPFLFIIEIVSFLVRPFSLGIRLFANVMSGHILMHMFFSTFIFCYKISFFVSLLIFSFCLFIFFMELFVSFIQAYIFMILLLVYSIDLVNIH